MSEQLKKEVLKVYLNKTIKKYYIEEMKLLSSSFRKMDDGSIDFCFTVEDKEEIEYYFEIYDLYYYSKRNKELDVEYIKSLINNILEEFVEFLSIKEYHMELEQEEQYLDIDPSLHRDEILDEFDITEDGNFHEKKRDPFSEIKFEISKEDDKYIYKYFEESSFSWYE